MTSSPVKYLSDLSPKDKPWDRHGHNRDLVRGLYGQSDKHEHMKLEERMSSCSQVLRYLVGEGEDSTKVFNLANARFCRVKFCPICQWRKSLKWAARFHEALPKIQAEYEDHRFIFLTLTVRNCPMGQLRDTVDFMDTSFKKLVLRSKWPGVGWIKSLEVTLGQDGNPHPHFHVLIMVSSSYFNGKNYLSKDKWMHLWKKCAKLDYDPIVHVKKVTPKKKKGVQDKGDTTKAILDAVAETVKYSVKESDLADNLDFLLGITDQLHKKRTVSLGGCFQEFLKEVKDSDDFTHIKDTLLSEVDGELLRVMFKWDSIPSRYYLKGNINID